MGLFEGITKFFVGENEGSRIPAQRPARNEQCWCGSGKKYKKCHLEEDEKKISASRCFGPS